MHLGTVGRDDTNVDALVQHALFANLLEIPLQRVERQLGLGFVDAPEALAHKLLGGRRALVVDRGLPPLYGNVVVQYATVFHRRRTLHLSVVEPVAGEPHNLFVHAILYLQQAHLVGMVLHDALHERLAQTGFQGGNALHRGRQLTMVARQYHARHLADGNPAGRFERLRRLIYK